MRVLFTLFFTSQILHNAAFPSFRFIGTYALKITQSAALKRISIAIVCIGF